jgi:hypothetical protein
MLLPREQLPKGEVFSADFSMWRLNDHSTSAEEDELDSESNVRRR